MDLSHPTRTPAPTLDLPVLGCLARQRRAWTTREVADATGATIPGVRQALDRLVDGGLVRRSALGRIRGYEFNDDHVMASAVRSLVDAPGELRRRITDQVRGWAVPAELVVVFGSWARGEAGPASDVDLLVLRRDLTPAEEEAWVTQAADLQSAIYRWSGNRCDLLDFSVEEWGEHIDRADPLVAGVLDAAIVLLGPRRLLTHPVPAAVR